MLNFFSNIFGTIQNTNLLSLEGVVFVFGKLCIVAMVYFANEAGVTLLESKKDSFEAATSAEDPNADLNTSKASLNDYQIIGKRNVFGTSAASSGPITAPVTQLSLRLVGTNITPEQPSFAIIEDAKSKEQDIFDLKDTIFGQARLIEIYPESVRIEYNGKIETLLLEEDVVEAGEGSPVEANDEGTEFVVSESEVTEALANLPRLLSQARAVPYFKDGKSVGMRLFAIRRGSLYEKLGLKNGDILKSVNNNNLSDPSQALKIFEQLKTERSIQVSLERAQQTKTMNYEIR